jgi:ribosome biogenesis protein Nip4
MVFCIKFEPKIGSSLEARAILLAQRYLGTDDVARIRVEAKEEVSLEKIFYLVRTLCGVVEGELTEEEVEGIDLFRKNSEVTVYVEDKSLNSYVKEVVEFKYNEDSGKISEASIVRVKDTDGIFNAWKEAGCPIIWENIPGLINF